MDASPVFRHGGYLSEDVMRLVILSESFYEKYAGCKEILKKTDRPYLCLTVKINGKTFAIPFRHHIRHPLSVG